MKPYSVWIFYILLCMVSCNSQRDHSSQVIPKKIESTNDTTRIVSAAIKSIFEPLDLPGIYALQKRYRFKDSILFSSDSISLNLLPKYCDSLKFKVLPIGEILSMIRSDSHKISTPNYLYIDNLKKNDSGYTVLMSSNSGLWYGSGGSFLIEIAKEKDSFLVINRLCGSIN